MQGSVDDRTIQKYEKEAKDKNRESWYDLSCLFFSNETIGKTCTIRK
jgi:translation elongation factor EF-1alpha